MSYQKHGWLGIPVIPPVDPHQLTPPLQPGLRGADPYPSPSTDRPMGPHQPAQNRDTYFSLAERGNNGQH